MLCSMYQHLEHWDHKGGKPVVAVAAAVAAAEEDHHELLRSELLHLGLQ